MAALFPGKNELLEQVVESYSQTSCAYKWGQYIPPLLTTRLTQKYPTTLQWRHNERDGVSNQQPHDCLLKRLFRPRSKKTSKLCVTGLCEGIHRWSVNSQHKGPVTWKLFPFDDVIMKDSYCTVIAANTYRQISNTRRTLVGNKIVDYSNIVGASPVGAAPATSSVST